MKDQSLRVLMVEDSEDDALLTIRVLKKGGYNPVYERVETAAAMKKALEEKEWDIILCDYKMPAFDGPSAIALKKEANIDIPFIVVTGKIGEETAADCMRLGAQDYIMKNNMSRLCPAIARELEDAKVRKKQKQAEEALRESEKNLASIYNTVGDVIFHLAVEPAGQFRFISVNTAFLKVTGLGRDMVVGKTVNKIIPEPSLTMALGKYRRAIAEKTIVRWEEISDYPTGRLTGVVSVAPVFDDKGTCTHLVGSVHDITERKKAEEYLRESERKYRELVNFAPAGIYEVDYETNLFTSVNDVVCEYTGYTRDELFSMNLFNLVTEESQQLMRERLKKLMANEKIPQAVEYCIRTKGGEELWVRLSARYIYKSGRLKGAMGVVYNITERKRAEKSLKETELKFRTIFNSVSDGILVLNADDEKFSSANEEICNMLGYTNEELLNMGISDLHPQEAVPFVIDQYEKLLKKEILIAKNIPVLRKDKTIFFADISGSTITLGEKEYSIGVFRDITERKIAEEALRESEKKYRELSIIDDLTQLYNSKHFHAQIEREIERSNSFFYVQPLTLLLLDLDKFKEFNDTYGHIEGDYLLSRLSQVIKQCLRETESAYRYGGKEFAIILPMTAIDEGIVKAKRIQAELTKETFPPMFEKKINITFSIGLAQYKPIEDMKTFVQRAEKFMCQAKKDGGDRICSDIRRDKHNFTGSS